MLHTGVATMEGEGVESVLSSPVSKKLPDEMATDHHSAQQTTNHNRQSNVIDHIISLQSKAQQQYNTIQYSYY